jgi:phosphonopyruvate decarboxylase
METKKQPFFFFVRKGSLDEYVLGGVTPGDALARVSPGVTPPYPLKRIDAIRIVAGALRGDELVVATTGKPSRELFSVSDKRGNFYMQGSMGHAASIGLGIALARPDKKTIVLDGDGALLMHMGVLSSVGHYKPGNFYHVVRQTDHLHPPHRRQQALQCHHLSTPARR